MPSEELISSIIDTAAIKKEVDNVEALLTNLEQRLQAIKEFKTQIQLSVNSSEVIAATQGANKAMQDLSNSAKDTTKTIGNLAGEYSKLKQQYADGIRDAKNLAAQFGVNSQQAKEAAASVATLRDRLSEIDKFVGGKKIISVETQNTSPTDVPFSNNLDAIEKEKQALQEKGDVLSELDRQQAEAANSATALGTAQEESSKKTKTSAGDIFAEKTALETLNGSRKENITTLLKYQAELASNKAQQKSIDADLKAGTITQKEYNSSKIALVAREKELKVATGELSRTIQSQTKEILAVESSYDQLNARLGQMRDLYRQMSVAERESDIGKKLAADIVVADTEIKKLDAGMGNYQRNVGNYSGAFTGYANTLRGLRGPTKLLGEALGIGAQEADQFRLVIEHAFQGLAAFFRGKEAKAAAQTKDLIVTQAGTVATQQNSVAITQNAVATQRQVVAYEEATLAEEELTLATTGASTALKVFRVVMLGLGIGVVIGLIAYAVVKYREFKKAAEEAKAAQKDLNEAIDSTEYKDAVKNLYDLTENIKLAKEGFLDKNEVLHQYNETIGKTTGQVKTLDEAEAALVKNGDAYVKMMLYKAAANIALEEASKKAYEAEKSRQKSLDDFTKSVDKAGTTLSTSGYVSKEELQQRNADALRFAKQRKDAEVKISEDGAKKQLDIMDAFRKKAAKIANDNKFDFFSGGENDKKTKDKKEKAPSNKDYYIDALKAQEEAKVAQLEIQRDLDESLAKNDKENFLVREDALKSYVAVSIQILGEQKKYALLINDAKTQEELKKENLTVKQIADIRAAGNDGRLKIEAEFQKKASKVRLDGIKDEEALQVQKAKELLALAEKTALERDRIEIEGRNKRKEDEAQFFDEIGEIQLTRLSTSSVNEQRALLEQYEKGKIGKEKYERDLLAIQKKYALEALKIQLKVAEQQLALMDAGTKQYDELQNKIANVKLAISQNTEDTNKETKDQITKDIKHIVDAYTSVAASIENIIGSSYDKQKNKIQEQINLIDKQKDAELQANDATAQSASDKANNIAIINARAAAKKDALDRQQKDIERKKAKAEKAFAATQVIINTAMAVTDVLRTGGGAHYLDFGASAGILSAVVTATGAAQLAAILAQPIPEFKTGKNVGKYDNYEGPAWVGDGGRRELIIREDGKIELTPSVPTLTHVNANDIILPDASKINYLPNFDTSLPVDKYREVLNNAAISATLRMGGSNVNATSFDSMVIQTLQSKLDNVSNELRQVKNSIDGKPVAHVTNTWSGLQVSHKSINGWNEYVNKYFKS